MAFSILPPYRDWSSRELVEPLDDRVDRYLGMGSERPLSCKDGSGRVGAVVGPQEFETQRP